MMGRIPEYVRYARPVAGIVHCLPTLKPDEMAVIPPADVIMANLDWSKYRTELEP